LNTYLEKAEENALHHPTEEEGEEQGFTLTGGSNTKKKTKIRRKTRRDVQIH
jgi:hypothetical protein